MAKVPQLLLIMLITYVECVYGIDYMQYYKLIGANASIEGAEKYCNKTGRYLASIHSVSQLKQATNLCSGSSCWIGLKFIDNTWKWTDQTDVDLKFMCSEHEYSNFSDNIPYYVYIVKDGNCWNATSSLNWTADVLCGPHMFDVSGCFWELSYVSFTLSIIALFYAGYVLWFLWYNLYGFEHNWILEPSKWVKCTAILLPFLLSVILILLITYYIMIYVAYNKWGIMPPISFIKSPYPDIYIQSTWIFAADAALYLILTFLGYAHVLLRIKNKFDHNEIMRSAIPKQCIFNDSANVFYCIVIFLTAVYSILLPAIYPILSPAAATIVPWFILDLTINLTLLYLYTIALHAFSKQHYWRYPVAKQNLQSNCIDPRQHELMLEATRYNVLFGMVSIVNIVQLVVIGILSICYMIIRNAYIESIAHSIGSLWMYLLIYSKEMTLLVAIHLSFKFSHDRYEKVCGYCDKQIKICCHKLARKNNAEEIIIYEELTERLVNKDELDNY